METLLESECNEKWKHLEQTYELRSKIAELPFAHLKQYMRLTEFTTI